MLKFTQYVLIVIVLGFISLTSWGEDKMPDPSRSVSPLFMQDSMNVFRRFEADAEIMYNFYGKVLGFEQLMTFNLGGNASVARFQIGDSQVKLSGVVPNRSYYRGGIPDATGIRLLTFFFTDGHALEGRFKAQRLPIPVFRPIPRTDRRHALLKDPDGQWVELVIVPDSEASACSGIEIGLVVSDLVKSRNFYSEFVGLEALPPEDDNLFDTQKYPFRHGSTIISLRSFGAGLPADTGSGGIQYVVSDAEAVEKLAKERHVVIDQPLSTMQGFALRTIWLDDPDGITNYFAQVRAKENR